MSATIDGASNAGGTGSAIRGAADAGNTDAATDGAANAGVAGATIGGLAEAATVGSGDDPLSGDDLDLLDTLLDAEGIPEPRRRIPKRGAKSAPLSAAQRRLWFLHQLDPHGTAYTIAGAALLRGPLDAVALEAALRHVVVRHEALRTTFEAEDGEPRQIVHEGTTVRLEVVTQEGADAAEAGIRVASALAGRPWDLARGPLVRAALVRASVHEHALALAMPHIVSDGWSLVVMTRELAALYEGFAAGSPPPLREPPIQYTDHALWQDEWLRGEEPGAQVAYWTAQLVGAPERLELPADRPRPRVGTDRGGSHAFDLSADLSDSLASLAKGEGATLFMALLAAFQTLLCRYTGATDIVVGTPVAGRERAETEEVIGLFVNTLALRTDLSGDPSFRTLLQRVRTTARGAYAHQELPFDRVVQAVHPRRERSRTPLFEVLFALQPAPVKRLVVGGLELIPLEIPADRAQFDLTLSFVDEGDRLRGALVYSTDRFDEGTIARMAGHYTTLLEGVLARPDARISELPLLTAGELRALVAGEDADREGGGSCIHELFEAQAARTPDAVAVVADGTSLTYAELDRCASRLAGELSQLGIGPDALVGLCMERSAEMVVGMLGILKAGGAYVPLDPSYPRQRLAAMMNDAGASVVLTQSALRRVLPETPARLVCLEPPAAGPSLARGTVPAERRDPRVRGETGDFADCSDASGPRVREGEPGGGNGAHGRGAREGVEPAAERTHHAGHRDGWARSPGRTTTGRRRATPESLAYVIFTSGSTGRPRGVMVSHRALVNHMLWMAREFPLSAGDRVLQKTPTSFDASVWEFYAPLLAGARLVMARPGSHRDPASLAGIVAEQGITILQLVPSLLGALVEEDGIARCRTLARVFCGGEALTGELRDRFFARVDAELINLYGPTEATIDATFWRCGRGSSAPSVPIGKPIDHVQARVLDSHLRSVPAGVAGELFLAGAGLARGYLNRPDLTAERFLPDPFGLPPGGRLYRTGDRARHRPDGTLEYLGRMDRQVKVRGFRIEPDEVEGALLEHAAVREAAVIATEEKATGGAGLSAFYVTRGDVAARVLREHLRSLLPEPLVPWRLIRVDALPLTPSGKVDRALLAGIAAAGRGEETQAYVAPANPLEEIVAGVWADLLGLERVGADTNVFDLGGHSLLATRVASRLRASLGVEVPLRDLFDAPTVRGLAGRIEAARGHEPPPPVARAPAAERRRPSYAQRRLWFLDRLEPDTPAYHLPSSVRLQGDLDVAALERALAEVMRRHEALRTRFVEGPDGPEQVVDEPAPVAIPLEDLSGMAATVAEREARRLAREEARRPFDLSRGPVARFRLLRLGPREHVLLVTLHHIAADGWSLGVLVRELSALYGAYREGREHGLEELAVQYADWGAWQRAWLEGGEMERQLAYWRRELDGVERLALPPDRPRPPRPTLAGGSLAIRLEGPLRQALESVARAEGATLHMALLAGYAEALGRWSGQKEVTVAVPVANRRTAEAEPLIGFFVNTLAMRVRLGGGGLTFRGLLRRVRETALGAHANQDVPFDRVVETLQPDRHPGSHALAETLFVLQNAPLGAVALPGLSLAYEETETGVTRFDVELLLMEAAHGLEGTINYSADLFEPGTIERFAENVRALLEAAAAEPDRPLATVEGLALEERRRVLVSWNAAREQWPDAPLAHTLFERHAALAPDAPAARLGAARLSYGELNRRANRLARALRRRGAGAGDLVAVCVERSFDMLVAVLAALKAGAAYVPIDPRYPEERIGLLLEDAGRPLMLTQSQLVPRLGARQGRAILLDEDADETAAESGADLGLALSPDALVYVVYTSGSTGRPKGIAMTHRAVSNLLSWQRRDSGRDGAPRTLQFASLSFDVSFQEIFSTLTAGGEVVLVTEDERRDAPGLLRLLAEQEVERLFVPFVALEHLAETARSEGVYPARLREIATAGEQLRITPAIAALFARLPRCRLVNHYGPSETHLVTTFELRGRPARWPELPPIGRPIANAPVYLLDEEARLVPIGAVGELYVGGAGLARGYHARPDLTAERFVPDRFSDEPGRRLYRTGDLGRLRADGTLEFLGRRDLQIKVRGHRVEPGEIEATLARHPAIRQAAVAARDHRGGKRLAAYVVLRAPVGSGELRDFLARTLPEFMVPAAIVPLDALPVSPNGKVDRGALPEPEWGASEGDDGPRSPEEEVVCGIFSHVLERDGMGARESFFDLGGHSLLATQVLARVRKALGAEVSVRAFFEDPTPAGVTAAALASRRTGVAAPPRIGKAETADRGRLSYAQKRLWFLDRLEPGSAVYNLTAALRLEGDLDTGALGRALVEIVRRHEALRTRFEERPEGPEAIADAPFLAGLEAESLESATLGAGEEELRRILEGEGGRPFDLARGPMLRARLLRLGPREHVLSVVAHHIAADGWSLGVILRELEALYTAYGSGRESPLEEPPLQYADWAAWQRAWLEGGELDRQLAWWRTELSGAPRSLELPADRARPARATGNGATLDVALAGELRSRLGRFARSEGATLHMALLAGYAWTLMRHGGVREIVVGTPVANRRAEEAESLVGFFVNTLAVRVRGGGRDLTYRELLSRVREASLGAYANQDVPFERVVEEIQPERALNRAPLFQTAFALNSARPGRVTLPGLRVTPLSLGTGTAKFDLMLLLQESGEDLEGAFEYSTDLFDRASIETIAAHFEAVLRSALRAPDAPLEALRWSDADEERRILDVWSRGGADAGERGESLLEDQLAPPLSRAPRPPGTAVPRSSGSPPAAAIVAAERGSAGRGHDRPLLHELIERQAALTPEAPALACGSEAIGYGEMDRRASVLARYLRSLGAGPEQRVALLLERAPEAIVALLAILKAGGAYLPLDPEQPAERLRWLVEDCGARLVVTESRLAEGIAGRTAARLVMLDRVAASLADAAADDRRARDLPRPARDAPRPENLAYVIYTSGSTGRPKGVGVEHRQIASYVEAVIERLEIGPRWRFALASTLAADLGHTSIFAALATGGSLHVLPRRLAFDPEGIATYLATHAIDALKIVPSHLQALLTAARPERVLPSRLLVLGGEATPGARLAELRRIAPGCRVAIHYGPTEATVGAAAGSPTEPDAARAAAPLGRPLANARAYLLDERGGPVPAGVPGELYLGGAGVARGYLGRTDLTAERFVPDPFAGPGARMYRTGDRARWLRDGRLEFLGRTDGQVKVRGHRVEPGEVEAAIAAHPGVRQAAVVARPHTTGARLVAYVAAEPRKSPTIGGLNRRRIPGGLAVAERNRNETDYLHREIFERGAYVRHGIVLEDGDVVFDVGANIGLFTVFASLACASPRVFAFEPNPRLLPILRANAAAYAPDATVLGVGLAEREGEAPFTEFPGFSLLSGLHADPATEKRIVVTYLENQAREGAAGASDLAQEADAILDGRFSGRTFDVRLRTVSGVMAEHGVPRIDLLKVNVEKAELEVLRGIRAEDWGRIRQAVVEVDLAANLPPILELLASRGFEVLVDQDPLLERTDLRYVYAARRGSGRALAPGAAPSFVPVDLGEPLLTGEALRAHVAGVLPEPMVPAAWVFLDTLPLTANGKLDRDRLPEPRERAREFTPPRGRVERAVAAIWAEALGLPRVGVHDNFFDVGGHSLLLARVAARLRESLGAEVPIVDLFQYTTIASLAARLAQGGDRRDSGADRARGARRRDAARARARIRRDTAPAGDV